MGNAHRRHLPLAPDAALHEVSLRTTQHLEKGDRIQDLGAALPRDAIAAMAPPGLIACRRGCAACCHQDAAASAVEVLDLRGYLQALLSAPALRALAERALATAAAIREAGGRDARFQRRVPCVLLGAEGACAGYPRRPLSCAGENATEASACAEGAPHTQYGPQVHAAARLTVGVCIGSERAGLDGRPLELSLGLAVALNTPGVEARWRSGEAVFAPAYLEGADWPQVQARLRSAAAPSDRGGRHHGT